MSRHTLTLHALIASCALCASEVVFASNLGLAVKASTLGYGLEADYALTEKFSLRGQFNTFSYDDDFDKDGVKYKGSLDLSTFGLLVDWHPMGGGFRVTGGVYSNGNSLSGVGTGEGTYTIGDQTYTVGPDDTLRATADVDLGSSIAPYFGIGWGHAPSNKGGLLLSFDIGVLAQGSPDATLAVTGTANNGADNFDSESRPDLQAQVRKEEQNLEDDLSNFEVYPVISFGIGWRF